MKTKKAAKKLALNKSTVVDLGKIDMNVARGGQSQWCIETKVGCEPTQDNYTCVTCPPPPCTCPCTGC